MPAGCLPPKMPPTGEISDTAPRAPQIRRFSDESSAASFHAAHRLQRVFLLAMPPRSRPTVEDARFPADAAAALSDVQ